VKLYNDDLSPFASRVRTLIYAKGLDVACVPPPGGAGSDEYKRVNPTGKVPALVLDDGSVLPESTVICEYLEDRFPVPGLRPADAEGRARMRLVCQLADLYLWPALHALFPHVNPAQRDAKLVAAGLAELGPRYDLLAAFLRPAPYAVGASLTIADCALAPFFFFATRVHPMLGDKDPVAGRPRLAGWWDAVREHDAVARVDAELGRALAKELRGRT